MYYRLFFILTIWVCLGSCHSLRFEEPQKDRIEINRIPDIPNPPSLSYFLETYGEIDGSRLYLKELEYHISFLKFYLKYTAKRYDLPMVLERKCIFVLPSGGMRLPPPPYIKRSSPPTIIDRLATHITDILTSVDNYNELLEKQYEQYRSCIN